MPPTDPRYLSMTDEDIIYEYECWLVYNGEDIKTCPRCGTKTHKTGCVTCKNQDGEPLPLTGDDVMDDIISRLERGEELDLEKELFGEFETVAKVERG